MIKKPLSEIQEPIKKDFADHPEKAVTTLTASAERSDRFTWDVSAGNLKYRAALPASVGGTDDAANPAVVFLSSLCVCAGITLSAAAEYLGIELRSCRATATGIIDLRGTLAVSEQTTAGFSGIDIKFEIDSDADELQLELLLEAAEKHSVNCRTSTEKTLVSYDIVES